MSKLLMASAKHFYGNNPIKINVIPFAASIAKNNQVSPFNLNLHLHLLQSFVQLILLDMLKGLDVPKKKKKLMFWPTSNREMPRVKRRVPLTTQ